jgi:hypothetical protein
VPAEPKRSDFLPSEEEPQEAAGAVEATAEQVGQTDQSGQEEAEGWPLYDETGETVGNFSAVEWAEKFERLVADHDGAAQGAVIDNNRETAAKVASECADEIGSIIADGLKAITELVEVDAPMTGSRPQAEKSAAPPRAQISLFPADLCPEGASQDDAADKVVDLIKASPTVARVNAILKANAERMKGWRQGNKSRVTIAADDKLEDLQMGEFQ